MESNIFSYYQEILRRLILFFSFYFLLSVVSNAQIPSQCQQLYKELEELKQQLADIRDLYKSNGQITKPVINADLSRKISNKQNQLNECLRTSCYNKTIKEGLLYRECSHADIFVIQDGKKIRIPGIDALKGMGFQTNQEQFVPDGYLNTFQIFDIPSSSTTPGSLIFPPKDGHHPILGLSNTIRVFSQGKEVRLVELRGWLRSEIPYECNGENDGADKEFYLELDIDWVQKQGMDIHKLFTAGSVIMNGIGEINGKPIVDPVFNTSPRKKACLPVMKLELNSWGWRSRYPPNLIAPPLDWTFVEPSSQYVWPFDPHSAWQFFPTQPLALSKLKTPLKQGQYVRVCGSLVTDDPHYALRPNAILSRLLGYDDNWEAEWIGSIPDWSPGLNYDNPNHFARWTEVHPPDLIQYIGNSSPKITTRALALCARTGINACEEIEFDIAPESPRPSITSKIRYQELRGPECFFPWGEDQNNGSWITMLPDRIHIKAKVCGGFLGGSPGRFKAIYLVWWE